MLIVFEGIDGSGKTTLAKLFYEYLKGKGYETMYEHEPTDSKIGKLIKEYLKEEVDEIRMKTLASLFAADRYEHIKSLKEKIEKKDIIIIMDRFYHSSLAYQSVLLPLEWILELNKFLPKPDYVFILDVDPEIAAERIKDRVEHSFERVEFLKKVRENYLKLKDILKDERIIYLDATKSPKDLLEEVIKWTGL